MSKSLIDHTSTQKFNQNRHLFQPQNSGTQIDSINIGLASPTRIRKWAERILPNGKKVGEVVNSKTVNYKTLKPEVGGLFCEKIFGPIEDFECLCAPTKRKSKTQNKFCPDCDVEFTVSRIRRYRLGYIKLASPVSHIWYLRGRPRFLNILFDRGVALKTGKKKGKIKDFKPVIYGIDGIYVPILRLIKTSKKSNVKAREGDLSLGLAFNRQKEKTVGIAKKANFYTKGSESHRSSEVASLENRNFSLRFAKFYATYLDYTTENKVFVRDRYNFPTRGGRLQTYFTGLRDNATPSWKIVPTLNKQSSILCEPEREKSKIFLAQVNRLFVDDFCNPTAFLNGYTLWRRPMLRIKPKVDLHKKKKGLLLLRGCLVDLKKYQRSFLRGGRTDAKRKKSEQGKIRPMALSKANLMPWEEGSLKPRTIKLIPRFPHYFVSGSKLTQLSEFSSQQKGDYLHPFGRKNRKTDLNPLSLQPRLGERCFVKKTSDSFNFSEASLQKLETLNLSNFPYYTMGSLFSLMRPLEGNEKNLRFFLPRSVDPLNGRTSLIQSKKQNTDETILQKPPVKLYPSLFTYNFLEKSGLLWHDFGNYNINPNTYTSLQFFLKSRYFTRKLRNIFFVDKSSKDPLKVKFHRIPKKTKFFSPWEGRPDLKREFEEASNLLNSKSPKDFCYCLAGNLLFKKKLTKIICNSGQCLYTIHSTKTLKKKNINLDSTAPFRGRNDLPSEVTSLSARKFYSRLDNTTPLVPEQNKHIVIDNKNQVRRICELASLESVGPLSYPPKKGGFAEKINDFVCKNRLFLNRTVVKAESFIFFTEKKSSLLPMGQYRNQSFSGFPLFKSKFFHSQKNLLDKNEFVPPTITVLEGFRSISQKKKTHLSRLPLFHQDPPVHDELKNTSLNFTEGLKLRSVNPLTRVRKNFVFSNPSKGPLALQGLMAQWGKGVGTTSPQGGKNRRFFKAGSLAPLFRISSPRYNNTQGPGFMTLTSNIKPTLRAKATSNKSVVISNNAFRHWAIRPGKENKFYDRYKTTPPLNEPAEFIPRSFYALSGKKQNFFRNMKNQDGFLTTVQSKKNLLNFSLAKQWVRKAAFVAKQPRERPFGGFSLSGSSGVGSQKLRTMVPDKSSYHVDLTASSNFSSNNSANVSRFSKQKKTKTHLQSQIDPYYPLSSRCVFKFIKGDENKTLEFKSLWRNFVQYMTSNFVKQDAVIRQYSNRLGNRSIIQNGVEYKYIKVVLTGSEAICYWLKNLNLHVLESILKKKIKNLDDKIKRYRSRSSLYKFQEKTLKNIIQYRRKVYRIAKLVYYLKKNKLRPDWLMISILPVLPPNLRPIIQLQSNQTAVSDLNQLYKRVLYRNLRIEKYLNRSHETDSHEIRFHQRLLQEAVDSLLDNGKGGSPLACSPNGRPFKSLAEILKGKKGRFRQNLLGKRVDYSGRSVIVVGPELKLHECGLPKEMAIELFQPFIIRDLINLSQQANDDKITIITAKHLIKTEHSIVWQILQKILKNHPILLNRAPTLHRLGIQAFQPKLVQGRAILLHPLVCPAFNADFDGDQMAVHVPLCFQSRAEAWKLMWSRNNLLSPATGEPIVVPSQDMVLGCYYVTTINNNSARRFFNPPKPSSRTKNGGADLSWPAQVGRTDKLTKFNSVDILAETQKILINRPGLASQNKNVSRNQFKQDISQTGDVNVIRLGKYFSNLDDVLVAFSQNKVSLHSLIWVKWENNVELENFNEKPVEVRVDYYGNIQKIYSKYFQYVDNQNTRISQFILTTVGRIILNKTLP